MPSKQKLIDIIRMQTEIAKVGFDLGYVMRNVVEYTLPLADADGAAIEIAEENEMVYRAASGIASNMLGLRLNKKTSMSGLSVETNTLLTCDDSETDPRVDKIACRKIGVRSMIVMPLEFKGQSVGVLKAMYRQPNGFRDKDVVVMNLLAEMVAASMYYSEQYNHDELFKKATHDSMTGLANKALFMDRLRCTLEQSKRADSMAALVIGDMDGLKQINDTIGHRAGDAAIKEFAQRIKNTMRDTDTAARIGGDEFGFILTPLNTEQDLPQVLNRFESALIPPFKFENQEFHLKVSLGTASIPHDGDDMAQVYDLADQRMYQTKRFNKQYHSSFVN